MYGMIKIVLLIIVTFACVIILKKLQIRYSNGFK